MRRRTNPVAMLVGAGLIIVGVLPFLAEFISISINTSAIALLIAGGAVLLGLRRNAIGTVALAVWLLAFGVIALVPSLTIPSLGTILSVLAIIAGIMIIIDR
ncbi:MAG TPA: hypothetical protein VD886_23475 [Herpetosiphonaceae bacterium]|nr:hypothetical protein [Herpetosiphonaceae bacterium]